MHHGFLLFLLVVCLAMLASVEGFATFFRGTVCPDGWSEAAEARGRVIVSVADPMLVGVTVGQPLAAGQAVQPHSHSVTLAATLPPRFM
jgi:hypothetical protein